MGHFLSSSCNWLLLSCPDIAGSPPQDCATAAPASPAAEAGPLLTVQCHGADFADVRVRPSGALDGLHLVHDWAQRARDQRLLGNWWVFAIVLQKYSSFKTIIHHFLPSQIQTLSLLLLFWSSTWKFNYPKIRLQYTACTELKPVTQWWANILFGGF